ncbi:hypothetical protein SDC9_164963 [bioreactor metagenome]|uniref:Uncharacterized protein n=1 Tax=bioreactor metagenome TaxID=1076179 RepID=A0A645FT30_9ZZZZ
MDNWLALTLSSFSIGYITRLWRERKPSRTAKKKSKFVDLLIALGIGFVFYLISEGK